MANTDIKLVPFLQFQGDCEETSNFYRDILEGRIEIASRYDNPAMNAPEDIKNKILHASFFFERHSFFASDIMPKKQNESLPGNIAISLGLKDESLSKDIFDKLSSGRKIHVPFKKQFRGDSHGNFTDRFGIRWMVN